MCTDLLTKLPGAFTTHSLKPLIHGEPSEDILQIIHKTSVSKNTAYVNVSPCIFQFNN